MAESFLREPMYGLLCRGVSAHGAYIAAPTLVERRLRREVALQQPANDLSRPLPGRMRAKLLDRDGNPLPLTEIMNVRRLDVDPLAAARRRIDRKLEGVDVVCFRSRGGLVVYERHRGHNAALTIEDHVRPSGH